MRLTLAVNPQEIEPFKHIKPAPFFGSVRCGVQLPGDTYSCTLASGHKGPHIAHAFFRKVVAVWEGPLHPCWAPLDFDSFGLTRDDLDALLKWFAMFAKMTEGENAQSFFIELGQMTVYALKCRSMHGENKPLFMLEHGQIAELDWQSVDFLQAVFRGQRDTYVTEGRPAAARVLSAIMDFLGRELAGPPE